MRFALYAVVCLTMNAVVCVAQTPLKPVATLGGHQAVVSTVKYSPDGRQLVSGDMAGNLMLWKPEKTASLAQTSTGKGSLSDLHWVNRHTVVSAQDGRIVRWVVREKFIEMGALKLNVFPFQLSTNSAQPDRVYLLDNQATIQYWHNEQDAPVRAGLPASNSVCFQRDGETVLIKEKNGDVLIQNLITGETTRTFPKLVGNEQTTSRVALSGNNSFFASVPYMEIVGPRRVRVWSMKSGKLYAAFPSDHYYAHRLQLSPNGRFLIIVGAPAASIYPGHKTPQTSAVTCWDLKTKKRLSLVHNEKPRYDFGTPRKDGYLYASDFSPDSKFLAIGGMSGNVTIYKLPR